MKTATYAEVTDCLIIASRDGKSEFLKGKVFKTAGKSVDGETTTLIVNGGKYKVPSAAVKAVPRPRKRGK